MSDSQIASRRPALLSRWLAKALPFEHAAIRYALCVWLVLAVAAAAWAAFARAPATRALLARSSNLLGLEEDLKSADDNARTYDISAIESSAAAARVHLFRDAVSLDQSVVDLIEGLKSRGWSAILAAAEKNPDPTVPLIRATYQLELVKVARPGSADPANAANATDELLAFLRSVTERSGAIDINHFQVEAEDNGFAKAYITLAAAIAKSS